MPNFPIGAIAALVVAIAIADSRADAIDPQLIAESHYPLTEAKVYKFHSERADRDLKLMVSLPASYESSGPDRRYPVLYVVDGQWHFVISQSAAGGLHYDRGWFESIVVGITWDGNVDDANRLRFEDFTISTLADNPATGKADKYLDFLQYELIPWVDEHYRTRQDRVLVGSSLGGLIAMYCLFTRPALFTDYLASSPAIWWDSQVIRRYQNAFAPQDLESPVRLYMARGGKEWGRQDIDAYAAELQAQSYPNLVIDFDVIEGAGHGGLNPEAFTRGLQFFFENKGLRLDPALTSVYEGSYHGAEGLPAVRVRAEDGQLFATDNQSNVEMLWVAVGENRFYLPNMGMEAWFVVNENQMATELVVKTEGGELHFQRQEE